MNTQNKFYIVPSAKVSGAGYQQVALGIPEPAAMVNDLCFVCNGSFDYIPMNSIILREALLNSASFLKEALGLDISESKKVAVDPTPVEKKPAGKPVKIKSTEAN